MRVSVVLLTIALKSATPIVKPNCRTVVKVPDAMPLWVEGTDSIMLRMLLGMAKGMPSPKVIRPGINHG